VILLTDFFKVPFLTLNIFYGYIFFTLSIFCSTISLYRLFMNYDSTIFGQCATHEKQGQNSLSPSKLMVLGPIRFAEKTS